MIVQLVANSSDDVDFSYNLITFGDHLITQMAIKTTYIVHSKNNMNQNN